MSHTITVSDETFVKLQALAEPFVDTEETVIARLADSELTRRSSGQGQDATPQSSRLELNADSPLNLTHSKLLSATVAGRPLHRPKWNGLMDHLHLLAWRRFGSFEKLREASSANLREGRYEESGYRYLPEGDFSIQGVDSNLAWSHTLRLARAIPVPVHLRLEWRDKDGAARPGEEAVLEWAPAAYLDESA